MSGITWGRHHEPDEAESTASNGHKTQFSARDLMALDFPEPRHIVDGLISEGSAILAGRPKIGKSWLSLQIVIGVARGEKILGQATTNGGKVAYLALEDNPRRLKSRLKMALGDTIAPSKLEFFTEWPRLDHGGLEQLDQWLKDAHEPRLVVVDTLARVRPYRPRNSDPYDHDHAVMSSITELAGKHRVAIVLVHHTRKAISEDFIDSVTGTLGLSGGADATLVLTRSRGQADAMLSITGRDVDEQELALSFDAETCKWTLLGDGDEYRLTSARRDIVNIIKANKMMTPNQVSKALNKNRNTTRWLMAEMSKDGTLKAWGDGKYTIVQANVSKDDQHHQQDTHHQQDQFTNTGAVEGVEGVDAVGPVGSLYKNTGAA